ncbi:PEP-P10 [Plodia interpunctella granulovirus]|uniref:PEP-P10 n=1 Tax=Plodia interpunctella granulovirus TaxID=262175 RepID=A0A1L5JGJ9_9BBAC|nr:PEP-P10 [Plodia interpunctella granulovirus]APO13905.1 PEP-P10 [Plodia interpunctella granulovirus]
MSRLIFSTRVDGTDVPVFYSGLATDRPYVGVSELLSILGHSKTHAEEFPRSETRLWQDLAPNDSTYPPNKLFTTEVGFAVYFGKTKLTNWASFKRMFDTIASYIADPNSCNATNPLCMIPPGRNSGPGPNPGPGPSPNRYEMLAQILQSIQNNNTLLQVILSDVKRGGETDLSPVLTTITDLVTQVTDLQNTHTVSTDLTNLENNIDVLNAAVQTITTTLDNQVSTSLPNIESAMAGLINTANAFVAGAMAQWGSDTWDSTAYPVPTITNPFPSTPNVLSSGNLSQDVATTLESLQREVKRFNDYTDNFSELIKKVQIKV